MQISKEERNLLQNQNKTKKLLEIMSEYNIVPNKS